MTVSLISWSNSSSHRSQLGRQRAAVLNFYRQRTPNHKQVGFCWFEGAVSLVTGCSGTGDAAADADAGADAGGTDASRGDVDRCKKGTACVSGSGAKGICANDGVTCGGCADVTDDARCTALHGAPSAPYLCLQGA